MWGPFCLGGVLPLVALLIRKFFSCAVRLGSCSLCRPLSFVCFFDPFRALPFWALGVICLVLLPVCFLVPLCLCCAPLRVWLGPVVSVLFFGCCRLPSLPDVASLPPAVGPVWRPGPVCTLVPPSGYLVASVTAWLPCFTAGSVVVLCRPYFILSHGSKGFWPCVGFVSPSPPCCMCC